VLPVGNHRLSVTFTPSDPAAFHPATHEVYITVRRAILTITAQDKIRPPGVANPPLTARYSGFVNGDGASSLAKPVELTTSATVSSPPGIYPITARGNAVEANYWVAFGGGTLTVSAKQRPGLFWSTPAPITYGTVLDPAQLNALPVGGAIGNIRYSPPAGKVLGAGLHRITATFSPTNELRYFPATKTIELTVNKAPLTIAADNKTRPPGIANPPLTASYSGFVNGDRPGSLDAPLTLSTTATASSVPGSYPITVGSAADANYRITFANGTLTVTAKEVPKIDWDSPAPITYGAALASDQLKAIVPGGLAGIIQYSPPAGTVLGAGLHGITATFSLTDRARYTTATETVELRVNKAPLTIAADNKTRPPGVANPPLTASYSGFVNGDQTGSLAGRPSLSTTADIGSSPGAYSIIVSGGTDANYTIIRVNGTLAITNKEAPAIQWAKPASIVYGTPLSGSQLNASAGGIQGTMQYLPEAGTIPDAGQHLLTVFFVPADRTRYVNAVSSVRLTVSRAQLAITADDQTMEEGSSIPELTASYSGFVNGDTAGSLDSPPVLATAATSSSPAGSYPITASGANDANYSIGYAPGTLVVSAPAGGTLSGPVPRFQFRRNRFQVEWEWQENWNLMKSTNLSIWEMVDTGEIRVEDGLARIAIIRTAQNEMLYFRFEKE
jgi:hypothetical protein